jgi:hypothetical protein
MNNGRVKKKILETVASLARYEMDVWTQIGPSVQTMLVDAVSALTPEERVRDREILIAICQAVLSPEIEGTVWKVNSVILRTGAVPVIPEIVKIREKVISILFDLLKAAKVDGERREIINTLRQAGYTSI